MKKLVIGILAHVDAGKTEDFYDELAMCEASAGPILEPVLSLSSHPSRRLQSQSHDSKASSA